MRHSAAQVFACAGLLLGMARVNAAPRDWVLNPAIVQLDTPEDIYAIGDAHSDYNRLKKALRGAGLTDEAGHWTGGHAVLISTGDMIDKGPRALDVLLFYKTLRDDARSQGGKVIILAGNHEAEFLANPAAPKGAMFNKQLKEAHLIPAEVGACQGSTGEFLCSLAFGARVNEWFFSHAGNPGGRTLTKLMADLQNGVDHDGYGTQELVGNDSLLEARLDEDGPNGKSWLQEGMPKLTEQELLAGYAKALGVQHIVEGHKPTDVDFLDGTKRRAGEMFQRFGLLFLIDTGMSEGVNNSHGAVLRITLRGKKVEAVCPSGKSTVLWDEKTKQITGRAAPCPG
ncbi:MAG TPA: metallophosphoesterase [Bryobacteraceae bacterium]|jgi:hypothetical protein|nr:metallophosphoesterase [Bryobacteraceae bacterium]